MARKTIYCAQGFWWRSGQLMPGQVHQFLDADRALEGAQILAVAADGASAFSLSGEPDVDFWEDPVLLASFGDAPVADAHDQSAAA